MRSRIRACNNRGRSDSGQFGAVDYMVDLLVSRGARARAAFLCNPCRSIARILHRRRAEPGHAPDAAGASRIEVRRRPDAAASCRSRKLASAKCLMTMSSLKRMSHGLLLTGFRGRQSAFLTRVRRGCGQTLNSVSSCALLFVGSVRIFFAEAMRIYPDRR